MIRTGPANAPILIFGHGAGAGMNSQFLDAFATKLSERSVACVRFEFPYMEKQRSDGRRRPPDRMPRLEERFSEIYAAVDGNAALIGGKSMGGRVASHIADRLKVAGLICVGYPFHPPGKPENTRTSHLLNLNTPTLIVQGERDRFGSKNEVESYGLSSKIHIFWSKDGDHDLKPRRSSGRSHSDNLDECVDAIAKFIHTVTL